MHQTLYRLYRPRTFDEVIGQNHVVAALLAAVKKNKVAHAYLLTGPRGTGKTTVGRLLAKAVNCLAPTADQPICAQCAACQAIAEGRALDLVEIDAASNRGIDDIRALKERILFPPQELRRKVYLIDEVHMLTAEAANALLKTLEEPPVHALFILATTEPHKVPVTIQSRCQRLDFRRGTSADLVANLERVVAAEGATAEPAALNLIADLAEGGFRDSLTLLERALAAGDQLTVDQLRVLFGLGDEQTVRQLIDAITAGDRAAAFAVLAAAEEAGGHPAYLAQTIVQQLRRLLYVKYTAAAPVDNWEAAAADALTASDLNTLLTIWQTAVADARRSPVPGLALEIAAATWLERPIKQSGGEQSISQPAAATVAPPAARPAVTVQAAANPTISLDSQQWQAVLTLLITHNHSLSKLLQLAAVGPLVNGALPIYVPYAFHVETLRQPANYDALSRALESVLGQPVKPEFTVGQPAAGEATRLTVGQTAPDLLAATRDIFKS